jgi:hypothetical protein
MVVKYFIFKTYNSLQRAYIPKKGNDKSSQLFKLVRIIEFNVLEFELFPEFTGETQ